LPARLRFDNGPEFTAVAVADWAERNGVELEFIKPGRPMQNGFIERFNRTYREAVLDMYIFDRQGRGAGTDVPMDRFLQPSPSHASLGGSPTSEFLTRHLNRITSTLDRY
jgi:putative transposase